jgi:inosose dehydratase
MGVTLATSSHPAATDADLQDESSRGVVVANAPVSYGAFELTVGINPHVPDAQALLDFIAQAGYAGVDLGPVGYLGTDEGLRSDLLARGLGLAGGYIELPYSDHASLDDALPELDGLLDAFDATRGLTPPPKPTLADAGSAYRRDHPGVAARDRSVGLDEAAWRRFGEGLARIVEHCRGRGYEPTFHPETGTYVEAEWEIGRVLELSDIGLCLDTGHLLVGGCDPLRAVEQWGDRINHVHLKDVHMAAIEKMVADGARAEAIWERRVFCRLGEGDLPVDEVLEALRGVSYSGWLVVEQDFMPDSSDQPERVQADQVANRDYLRTRGF